MGNPEHLEILKQGVDVWNKWRIQNLDITPDLLDAILIEKKLRGANLKEANLSGSDLRRTDLSEADLTRANLREAKLVGADIFRAKLVGADLNRAYLGGADLFMANLNGAILFSSSLSRANLSRSDLRRTDLSEADLTRANLREAKLVGADIFRAKLVGADLSRADLSEADLGEVNLSEANLSGVKLRGAKFDKAIIRSTFFANVDLGEATGLEAVYHFGPSTISIDVFFLSNSKIPEVFLRGAGVPDTFVEFIDSLTGKAFEYYSCFISYSSKDQKFAKRLYVDLQSKGVRSWFAPEDMKIGDKIRQRIDETIRIHDKLLLVLSENSINSVWVEKEVEAAFEKESSKKTVLFPVRLDDAVMETDQAWAADIRRTRHIGDFTNWKDHDAYKKAFERLLNDLKAEE